MTAPSDVQAAIVSGLATRYPDFAVAAHGGQFTERELPLLLGQAPTLLVAIAGISGLRAYGETDRVGVVRWAVYVLGADIPADPLAEPPEPAKPRMPLASDTAFDLLWWIPEQRWNLGAAARIPDPDSFAADNLYTGHVNILRVSLWGVTWSQAFQFTPE